MIFSNLQAIVETLNDTNFNTEQTEALLNKCLRGRYTIDTNVTDISTKYIVTIVTFSNDLKFTDIIVYDNLIGNIEVSSKIDTI